MKLKWTKFSDKFPVEHKFVLVKFYKSPDVFDCHVIRFRNIHVPLLENSEWVSIKDIFSMIESSESK